MVQRFVGALLVIVALSLPQQVHAAPNLCFSLTSGACFDFSGLGLTGSSGSSLELGSLNGWLDDLIGDLSKLLDIDLTPYLPPRPDPTPPVSVPDPATWMLLIPGVAGVGAVAWRRKDVSA